LKEETIDSERLDIEVEAEAEQPTGDDLANDEISVKGELDQEPKTELSLEEQLSASEEKAAEYLDGWQRARAEFANARKRLERERAEAYRNASVDYAKKLLPILDDFDRALENLPSEIGKDNWFEGISLVRRKLESILDSLDVVTIEAKGQLFDPNFHEALALVESDDFESGIVVEEVQTGYRLGDRVIRPSLVNVSA
jgi:molecular chaperone GrpE